MVAQTRLNVTLTYSACHTLRTQISDGVKAVMAPETSLPLWSVYLQQTFTCVLCVIKLRVCVFSKQAYSSLNCWSVNRDTAFHKLHFPSRPGAPTAMRFIRSNTAFHVTLNSVIHTSSLNLRRLFLRSFPVRYVVGTQERFSGVLDLSFVTWLLGTEK
jgi:hypothetical protein